MMNNKMKEQTNEIEFLETLCTNIENINVKELAEYVLFYYYNKTQKNKKIYFGVKVVSILIGLIITKLTILADQGIVPIFIVTIVTAVNTSLVSLEALFQNKDSWFNFSRTYDSLKKKLYSLLIDGRNILRKVRSI